MSITIAQIAQLCGVSRGTVDRALNNKGNVRPEVCARIKQVAAEHGYTPNRAGRALVRARKPSRIGVVVHSGPTAFFQMLLQYSRKTAQEVGAFGAQVIYRTMEGLDPAEMVRMIDDLVENEHIDALAITPLSHVNVQEKINDLTNRLHIPVITFNTDLPTSKRLCYVGQDNVAAGRTAAGLMGLMLGRTPAQVLPITGPASAHFAYIERMFGFSNELMTQFPELKLLPVQDCFDQGEAAARIVTETLKACPDLAGIYVASTGYDGVCRALIESGKQNQVRVIAHDLTPHNLWMARQQVLDFVIGQGAQLQGSLPIRFLQDYLDTGALPDRQIYHTAIEVRFHYNITEQDCSDLQHA